MKHLTAYLATAFLFLMVQQAWAVVVYECEDGLGNRAFERHCPPGTTLISERKIYTGKKDADIPDVDITFYTVPSCDACDIVRNVLDKYGAQYAEKNVKEDVALQIELQERTGEEGTLSVPTVIIGEKMIIGHNKQNLVSILEEAGFKLPEAEGEELASESPFFR
jgi:glutaredoxin